MQQSTNSLIDKGGTLDQLTTRGKALDNTQFPVINTYKDLLAYNAGGSTLAAYKTTLLGVADDYAKVMGGGQGTDSARNDLVHNFTNALNDQARCNLSRTRLDQVTTQRWRGPEPPPPSAFWLPPRSAGSISGCTSRFRL